MTSGTSDGTVPRDATGNTVAAGLISLVVPTYKRCAELEPMLRSMLAQTDQGFELIVVDQNEDDRIVPLLEPLERAGIVVRHLRLAMPGLAAARNFGVAHARGAIVGFPDDDCWYEFDVVERARGFLAACPKADGLVAHWVERDRHVLRPKGSLSWQDWRRFKGGDVACIALFFRMERLRAVGGFCEDFGLGRFFGSAEEEDLVFRMLAAGYRIDYGPDIHIHHFHADMPKLTARQCRRNRSYGRGTGAVLAKHRLAAWVIGRGLVGPWYHALRSARPATAIVLGTFTIWGRIEGLAGWWLWGRRQAKRTATET